jgi:hypothetical protein
MDCADFSLALHRLFGATARRGARWGSMPDPIQSSTAPNQSYYDPSEQVSRAPEATSSPAPAAPAPAAAAPPPPAGQELLIKKYGSGGEDCSKHTTGMTISLAVAGASALLGPVGSIGIVGGVAKAASDLNSYLRCEAKNDRMHAALEDCNQTGGALFAGAGDSEAICVTRQ